MEAELERLTSQPLHRGGFVSAYAAIHLYVRITSILTHILLFQELAFDMLQRENLSQFMQQYVLTSMMVEGQWNMKPIAAHRPFLEVSVRPCYRSLKYGGTRDPNPGEIVVIC